MDLYIVTKKAQVKYRTVNNKEGVVQVDSMFHTEDTEQFVKDWLIFQARCLVCKEVKIPFATVDVIDFVLL
jgi:hypothetical protein